MNVINFLKINSSPKIGQKVPFFRIIFGAIVTGILVVEAQQIYTLYYYKHQYTITSKNNTSDKLQKEISALAQKQSNLQKYITLIQKLEKRYNELESIIKSLTACLSSGVVCIQLNLDTKRTLTIQGQGPLEQVQKLLTAISSYQFYKNGTFEAIPQAVDQNIYRFTITTVVAP